LQAILHKHSGIDDCKANALAATDGEPDADGGEAANEIVKLTNKLRMKSMLALEKTTACR
jgi:hypothetical protein